MVLGEATPVTTNFSDTGSDTTRKKEKFLVPIIHFLNSKILTDVERRDVEIAAECHSIPINTIYKTNTRDTVFKDFQIYFICGHKVQAGQWSYIIYFGEGSIYNLVNSLINAIIVHHCAWLARTE